MIYFEESIGEFPLDESGAECGVEIKIGTDRASNRFAEIQMEGQEYIYSRNLNLAEIRQLQTWLEKAANFLKGD